MVTLYVGNSTEVRVTSLTDRLRRSISNARVTLTLRRPNGGTVPGHAWPLALEPVGSEPGTYRGVLPPGLSVNNGERLTAEVAATTDTATGGWKEPVVVRDRTFR